MKTFLPEFTNEIYCDEEGNFVLAITVAVNSTAAVNETGIFVVYRDMTAKYVPYLMPIVEFTQKYEIVNHEPVQDSMDLIRELERKRKEKYVERKRNTESHNKG